MGGGDDPRRIKRRDGAPVIGVASFDGRTKCRGLIKSPSGGHLGSPLPLPHIPELARDVSDSIALCTQYLSARINFPARIRAPNKFSPLSPAIVLKDRLRPEGDSVFCQIVVVK
ncbi:hypothetical protein BJP44_05480 [Candidatus Williamhamiltonella defendens]|nr:hypothetical protein BJP44_05480 [Candidatus Hamiltonella defensa]